MRLFIALSFALLGVVYWLASGGPSFVPEAREPAMARASAPAAVPAATPDVEATRAESPTDELAAPPPGGEALALAPAATPEAAPGAALPDEPLAPTEALAVLAPELAAEGPAGPEPVAEAAAGAWRQVTGNRVNLREGPGTGFGVVAQLDQGERAEVIESRGGWSRVRAGAAEGWMADRFLGALDG